MKIPFFESARQFRELENEITNSAIKVLSGTNYILRDEVSAFEAEWANYCQTRGAVGVGNGTDAISLVLKALDLENSEVITSTLSAGYTALAILNANAKPIFADIDEKTFNINPESVKKLITPKTRAILPVHLYGQACQMDEISEIAEKHNLFVIEDAAQAHGAKIAGKSVGSFGHAATFSFYPTKNLGAFGDGGAIVSNDENLLKKLKMLRQGGHFCSLQQELVGQNSRLDELQAALLRVKLKKLDEWNKKRQTLAKFYSQEFRQTSLILPKVENDESHVFHLYVMRSKNREKLRKFLTERGIETLIHYPFLLHQQTIFQTKQTELPIAEKIVNEIFSLPLHPHLTFAEIEKIVGMIKEFESKNQVF